MRQSLITFRPDRNPGIAQRMRHDGSIVSHRVELVRGNVGGGEMLVVLRTQGRQAAGIGRVDAGVFEEQSHRALIDDGRIGLVLFVGLVQGSVCVWYIVRMQGHRAQGGDAFDGSLVLGRVVDEVVGNR